MGKVRRFPCDRKVDLTCKKKRGVEKAEGNSLLSTDSQPPHGGKGCVLNTKGGKGRERQQVCPGWWKSVALVRKKKKKKKKEKAQNQIVNCDLVLDAEPA